MLFRSSQARAFLGLYEGIVLLQIACVTLMKKFYPNDYLAMSEKLISIAHADGNGEWKSTFISNGSDKQTLNFITIPGSAMQ